MTIQFHFSTKARPYQLSAHKHSLVGVSGHEGAWHQLVLKDHWQFKDMLNAELDQDTVASPFLADESASSIYGFHSFVKTTRRHVKRSQSCPLVQDCKSGSLSSSLLQQEQGSEPGHGPGGWSSTSYQDGAGSRGRSTSHHFNPSLVRTRWSLQRTSLGRSPKQNKPPDTCRRRWQWSTERSTIPRSVLDA